ncbi:hypothetical protein MNBD_GAMMA12-1817 [hydrothermal vent metagenome]|uniref:Uncharacterized protein n=1 Tax=hydrothermal vent metagenome TaxID=652676 RepID=A0A3B0YTR9_9ZZZZ
MLPATLKLQHPLTQWRPPSLRRFRWLWQTTLTVAMVMGFSLGLYADVQSLGFTLGKTDYKTVTQQAPSLKDGGINKYSNGKMLKGMSKQFKIQGLKDTLFIFDKQEKLAVIMMTFNKHQFDTVFGYLKSKYALQSKRIPFVGSKRAVFKKEDVKIKMNAPHLSFDMDVMYLTDKFDRDYKRIQRLEQRQKNKREQSQF